MLTIIYIVSLILCFPMCCAATKVIDRKDVTVGLAILYVATTIVPVVNTVVALYAGIAILMSLADSRKSPDWASKKLF